MRRTRCRPWAPLCLLVAGLAVAGQVHAGGMGISAAPCGTVLDSTGASVTTSIDTIPFHYYKVPFSRGPHANRDVEFLWSDTYLSRFNLRLDVDTGPEQLTDLDRLGQAACETVGNPLGLLWTNIQVMYNLLAMQTTLKDSLGQPFTRPAEYDADENHPIGFRVAQITDPDLERNHLDTYVYTPSFAAYGQYAGYHGDGGTDAKPTANYGQYTSSYTSSAEDSVTGHGSTPYPGNSIQIPGPLPTQVGAPESDPDRWTRPSGLASADLMHEGQHAMNGASGLHMFASAAEVVTGLNTDSPRYDVDYHYSLSPTSDNISNAYPHWQSFTAWLAFNWRGTDTTAAGWQDDLLRRWAKGPPSELDLRGLALRLRGLECAECDSYPAFAGLDSIARVQRLIHDWRVACYVNSSSLPGGHYGFPPQFGFSPARTLGAWQNVDNDAVDDTVSVPPVFTLGVADRNVVRRHTVRPATVAGSPDRPLVLRMFGADYFVFAADPALASTSQDLIVRVRMPGLLRGRYTGSEIYCDTCRTVAWSGRLFASVVRYSQASDSLYLHPEWATGITTSSAVLDRVNDDLVFETPGFGADTKAVVVVVTLEDGPEGTYSTQPLVAGTSQSCLPTSALPGQSFVYPFEVLALARANELAPDPLPVAASSRPESAPAWSPDGGSLAFSGIDASGHRGIFLVSAAGGTPSELEPASSAQFDPSWSPRGDALAYAQARTGGRDLWLKTMGGAAQQLTSLEGEVHAPAFSPNGAQVAYLRFFHAVPQDSTPSPPGGELFWQSELRLLTPASGGDVVLASLPGDSSLAGVRWTPDGHYLYYRGTSENGLAPWHVYTVPVGGGTPAVRDALAPDALALDLHPGHGRVLTNDALALEWTPVCHTQITGCPQCEETTQRYPFVRLGLRDTLTGQTGLAPQVLGHVEPDSRWSPDGTRVALTMTDEGDANVYVTPVTSDHAPAFTSQSTYYLVAACQAFNLPLSATDPDGDAISREVFDLPSGATLQSDGTISWPSPVVGNYWIIARALDPQGTVASRLIHLEVVDQGTCGGGGGEGDPDPIEGGGHHSLERAADANRLIGTGYTGPARLANTYLDGAESGAWVAQTARLVAARSDSTGLVRTRVAALRPGTFRLDRARLLVVDHEPGTVAVATPAGLAVGAKHRPVRLTSESGEDLTQALTGTTADARLFTAGASLTLEWAAADSIAGLVLDCARASAADPASEWGVRIEVPDASGWTLVGRIHPRSSYDALAAPLDPGTPVRLAFVTDTYVREVAGYSLGESEGGAATVTPVELAETDTEGGIERLAAADSVSVDLAQGQGVTLLFDGPLPVAERERTLFLDLLASFTPEGSAGASSREAAEILPARFALRGNQPNPFGGGTTIRFDVPRTATIRIDVFDAQGRRVRTLANGAFEPGAHAVVWDGTDASGQRVRPGVYLYRMLAPGFRDQGRMVLLGR